ncbi:hypothetical protein L228DRAFT_6671 [Xylona heveae TC161]|uniref:tRNA-splicing endonuclease subunit Sen15 domain-containing protein n=1 Tax=Xylona heveae (strain CBS 132557 / TC161) TaxID=1328760 RepID=A0A165JFD0_XYLHT|nr:hypothetical protein L228DRAFT_6671 [Xylona heveae TC161]KZF26162.1 hypothetical protein L228DRAFT_6671 [Xylona heveae TC161]
MATSSLPPRSTLSEILSSPSSTTDLHPPYLTHLALQVQHNLEHQHNWTSLTLHTHSPVTPNAPLPRPMISGVPAQKLYIHPDEQIELIKAGINEKDVQPERMWVLPAHLKEKWTLRRLAEVFGAITKVPPSAETADEQLDESLAAEKRKEQNAPEEGSSHDQENANETEGERVEEDQHSQTAQNNTPSQTEAQKQSQIERNLKRILLATVEDDSTVVYYIIHDGLVKPRQN